METYENTEREILFATDEITFFLLRNGTDLKSQAESEREREEGWKVREEIEEYL